jgi:hypothetical protein
MVMVNKVLHNASILPTLGEEFTAQLGIISREHNIKNGEKGKSL